MRVHLPGVRGFGLTLRALGVAAVLFVLLCGLGGASAGAPHHAIDDRQATAVAVAPGEACGADAHIQVRTQHRHEHEHERKPDRYLRSRAITHPVDTAVVAAGGTAGVAVQLGGRVPETLRPPLPSLTRSCVLRV